MGLLLVCSLLLFFQDQPPEKQQDKLSEKCSLSGTVVDSLTGEPLNKVTLWLEPVGQDGATAATTTSDAKGQFALAGLDPGAYHLRGDRNGYVEMLYSVRNFSDNGTIVRLGGGQTLNDLNFKLTPAGAIVGTVMGRVRSKDLLTN